MNVTFIAGLFLLVVCGGILSTRIYHTRKVAVLIRKRMQQLSLGTFGDRGLPMLVSNPKQYRLSISFPVPWRLLLFWEQLLGRTGIPDKLPELALVTAACAAGFLLACLELDLPFMVSVLIGLIAGCLPTLWLMRRRSQLRQRFIEQLPSAIDLMVSILRSGHSIPQAVQSVAEELPAPCGTEFSEILHRMNLGQSLSASMSISALRFESFDLDLVDKAITIQSEVGGSLAELLDNTNTTLRQRLKLARQVKAVTAQSRLTAIIVGAMPFIVAAFLQYMSPGYLTPLLAPGLGQALLYAAIALQIAGIIIMGRLSAVKI